MSFDLWFVNSYLMYIKRNKKNPEAISPIDSSRENVSKEDEDSLLTERFLWDDDDDVDSTSTTSKQVMKRSRSRRMTISPTSSKAILESELNGDISDNNDTIMTIPPASEEDTHLLEQPCTSLPSISPDCDSIVDVGLSLPTPLFSKSPTGSTGQATEQLDMTTTLSIVASPLKGHQEQMAYSTTSLDTQKFSTVNIPTESVRTDNVASELPETILIETFEETTVDFSSTLSSETANKVEIELDACEDNCIVVDSTQDCANNLVAAEEEQLDQVVEDVTLDGEQAAARAVERYKMRCEMARWKYMWEMASVHAALAAARYSAV